MPYLTHRQRVISNNSGLIDRVVKQDHRSTHVFFVVLQSLLTKKPVDLIVANQGMEPSEQSVFFKKHGFYVKLSIVDDPVKARDLFASGQSHILWGTLDMIALFAPELVKDSRTVPVVCQQVDWSAGGDGWLAGDIIRGGA